MKKYAKPLIIAALVVDFALTAFLLVISVIMLASTAGATQADIEAGSGFINYLQRNPLVYGLAFVVPLFVLLAANIIGLVIYVRKSTKREPVKVNDLSDAQKEALRKELLKDLQAEAAKEAAPEKPEETETKE